MQAISYPAGGGEDITYGLRLSLGSGGGSKEECRRGWQLELGKIVDDRLRQRVLNQEVGVGVSDSWWYFKVVSGEESHLLLASLWQVSRLQPLSLHRRSLLTRTAQLQANLITRREAEAVLGKGPLPPSSPLARAPSIHRLPSLATLTAAYYAGAQVGTRVILGKLNVGESRGAQVLVGAGAVGGAVVVGSRSSRGTVMKGNATEEVQLETVAGGAVGAMGLLGGGGGGGAVKITVLSVEECRGTPFCTPFLLLELTERTINSLPLLRRLTPIFLLRRFKR